MVLIEHHFIYMWTYLWDKLLELGFLGQNEVICNSMDNIKLPPKDGLMYILTNNA